MGLDELLDKQLLLFAVMSSLWRKKSSSVWEGNLTLAVSQSPPGQRMGLLVRAVPIKWVSYMYTGKEIPALHPCMLLIHTNISIYQHMDWVPLITFFLPEVSISPEPSREAVGTELTSSTSCPAPTLTSHWQHGWHSPSGSIGSNQSTKKSQQSTELFPS